MTAIKRRLLMATAAALALVCSAGEMGVLPSFDVSSFNPEESSPRSDQRMMSSPYDVRYATVAHPPQDAWDALLRASSR